MRVKDIAAVGGLVLVAGIAAIAAGQSSPQTNPPPQSDNVLKVKTRVITVDVVATDSHGDVVRDLKRDEFEISDSGPQQIAQFAFIDKSASPAPAEVAQPAANPVYTNRRPQDTLRIPPTAILMDASNTPIEHQMQVHSQVARLVDTMPKNTPVAVFLLGAGLTMLQDFTSDPALLRPALDRMVSTYSPEARFSRASTIGALEQIAAYMRGYPGRKNLIWVSDSFPIAALPESASDLGRAGSNGSAVDSAIHVLSDSQVAFYAIKAGGLDAGGAFSAAKSENRSGPELAREIRTENTNRAFREMTMIDLAEGTGGRTCINTNDLAGCIAHALRDSSSYYELAYYPQNIVWDGSFHKISVKTTRPGMTLSYRKGYYALDEAALAKRPPETRLRQACLTFLPATDIPLAVQAAPQIKPDELRYVTNIPVDALELGEAGSARDLKMALGICQFTANGASFKFTLRSVSQKVSDTEFQVWQAHGFREFVDFPPVPGTRRVRLAIVDERTGLAGAVDIPMRPEGVQNAAEMPAPFAAADSTPAAPTPAAPPVAPASPPTAAATPAPPPGPAPTFPVTSLGFRAPSGRSSTLDWSGDKISYQGELAVEESAPPFFQNTVAAKFDCENGKLAPRDPASTEVPNLSFVFRNNAGKTAMVDLAGDQPAYSGDLPVDQSARTFFHGLWDLCHCRAAPAVTSTSAPTPASN